MNGKRPHELLLLELLINTKAPIAVGDLEALFEGAEIESDRTTMESVERIFNFEFFTESDQKKYGGPIVEWTDGWITPTADFVDLLTRSQTFATHLDDIIETGLFLSRHRYRWGERFEVGKKYSRKDVCRLLNWRSDQKGTMYGYKVDASSNSCPIFVTYHKDDEVSASTSYEDSFVSENTLRWFTRSKRTLQSKEVQSIVGNEVPLYLFAKKDDAEGTDFYYLGRATSSNPVQTKMPGDNGTSLDVVTMDLNLDDPIEVALYDYLTTGPAIDKQSSGENAALSVDISHHKSRVESEYDGERSSRLF